MEKKLLLITCVYFLIGCEENKKLQQQNEQLLETLTALQKQNSTEDAAINTLAAQIKTLQEAIHQLQKQSGN